MSKSAERIGARRDHLNDFDMDSPELNEEYDQVIEELPVTCPVSRSVVGDGYYVLNRYQDIRVAAKEWKTFSSAKGAHPNRPPDFPYLYPVECDPPYHKQWRSALSTHFAPGVITGYAEQIQSVVNELIDGFIANGECDFVADFAGPLPAIVFTDIFMGIPRSESLSIQQAVNDANNGPVEGRQPAWARAAACLDVHLRKRGEESSRGDVVDTVFAGVDFEGVPCPWDHKLSVLLDVFAGGVGTTTYVLTCIAQHLATHPDIRKRFIEEPDVRPHALEEYLRYFSSVPFAGRAVTTDVKLGGHQFRPGDFVLLGYGSASRDPAVFDNAGSIDMDRPGVNRHASFGFGPHRCLGEHLARLEIGLALDILLRRLPEFAVRDGFKPEYETAIARAIKSLELVWDPPK